MELKIVENLSPMKITTASKALYSHNFATCMLEIETLQEKNN